MRCCSRAASAPSQAATVNASSSSEERLLDGRGAWQQGENPYPGLEPFTAELSKVFFGRAQDARKVVNQLRAMDSSGCTGGLLAVVGPSSCGKSSLLNVGGPPLIGSHDQLMTSSPNYAALMQAWTGQNTNVNRPSTINSS
jgi:ABC-type transport system involved in cytochrome bd biosynthesis fused ATPase/permease subunit